MAPMENPFQRHCFKSVSPKQLPAIPSYLKKAMTKHGHQQTLRHIDFPVQSVVVIGVVTHQAHGTD